MLSSIRLYTRVLLKLNQEIPVDNRYVSVFFPPPVDVYVSSFSTKTRASNRRGLIFTNERVSVILFIVRVQDICINYNAGNIG
jgi:hypothetical protein